MKRNGKISIKDIRSIARRIAKKFDVEKIILFGSYVYGMPSEGSDIDFLVVAKSNPVGMSLNGKTPRSNARSTVLWT